MTQSHCWNPNWIFINDQIRTALNPKHHQRILDLGYKVEEFATQFVFNKWYKELFKFSTTLEQEYQKFYNELKETKEYKKNFQSRFELGTSQSPSATN